MQMRIIILAITLLTACGTSDGTSPGPTQGQSGVCNTGSLCDDGNACTFDDICNDQGLCVGTPVTCEDDGSACGPKRSCNGTAQCDVTYPTEDTVCDDTDACTHTDHCNGEGTCQGESYSCSEQGTCQGDDLCSCEPGYTGDYCNTCDEGYIEEDGLCIPKPSGPMGLISAGPFVQGCTFNSDALCLHGSAPEHEVYLDAFSIDIYEVTAGDYKTCVEAGVCEYTGPTGELEATDAPARTYDNERDDHPINYVSWDEARAYCSWQGKRLPTESEWEKAARGTDRRTFPWGEAPEPSCELVIQQNSEGHGCGLETTWPVGSRPESESPYGLLDISGNVSEWVYDKYHDDYYHTEPQEGWSNPEGPLLGVDRSYRGGSWMSFYPDALTTFGRGQAHQLIQSATLGFRCARSEE